MAEIAGTFLHDLRTGARSLWRAKGLTIAVVVTLALGIGANAAMFSLIRGVLLRPLVNRDESRLLYIRQTTKSGNAKFSMPEVSDLRARVKSVSAFGDFSVIGFTMAGLGEPRSVRAGVVGGSYFEVMGLRPVLGRLLDARDDGPQAAGAVVLTYRFWSTALNSDPSVLGKAVRLGSFLGTRAATVVGVLEPCVPYPQDTEIIANVVTSPHHLSATMVTDRLHRMTELFGRLAPGATLETARAELEEVYGSIKQVSPEAYPAGSDYGVRVVRLRDQLTSRARTILLVLMGASVLVFIVACSNVANLILARSVRRETELGVRAALGASAMDLRRTLLSESLLLCSGGAALGVAIAGPMVEVLARYLSRYSVRALELTVDASILWVGAALAIASAFLLAFVPRLPSGGGAPGFSLTSRAPGLTRATNRRLRIFALVQIAASFVLVTAAAAAVKTLLSLEHIQTGMDTRHVLALNMPVIQNGRTPEQIVEFYRRVEEKIGALPGVVNVAVASVAPWRDHNDLDLQFGLDGHAPTDSEEHVTAEFDTVSPGFFASLGLPVLEGRDFTEADRRGSEPVAIVNESLARRMFPNGGALNHYVLWTDPMLRFAPIKAESRRIIGVAPDVRDIRLDAKPAMVIYHPTAQEQFLIGGRLVVNTRSEPYALVGPITRIVREMSADQPVEKAATLDDIRAEVLSPQRLNAMVSGGFAGVALLIAVVGVAGVLAFSVSGRTREFGIRLAIGSQPRDLVLRVIGEGAAIAVGGLAAGFGGGYWLAQAVSSFLGGLEVPGALPVAGAAVVLLLSAVLAAAIPAARTARIDVVEALRVD